VFTNGQLSVIFSRVKHSNYINIWTDNSNNRAEMNSQASNRASADQITSHAVQAADSTEACLNIPPAY
jgi:hypothetical protein